MDLPKSNNSTWFHFWNTSFTTERWHPQEVFLFFCQKAIRLEKGYDRKFWNVFPNFNYFDL